MGYRLGVDLGTTFTAAAVANGQPPTVLGLGNRALQIPSVLFLQDDGRFLYGEAAERRGAVDPTRVVREFKRRIGDPVPLLVAGIPFSPQALTARLLSWVVSVATERMGESPGEVVLTYPANWGAYKRELLQQVIALADLREARTCPEPEAAAIQYASHASLDEGARLVVYDLGGGTFDVCVMQKSPTGFTIVGQSQGIEHLGGIDFDEAVFRYVVRSLGDVVNDIDPDDPVALAGYARLRRDCVDAKEALSDDVDTVVPVSLPGLHTSVRLTRSEFEALIGPALQDTLTATTQAMRSAETTPEQLSAIVLVGGSSRIPLVGQRLVSHFNTATALDTHPKHDVALGAVQARIAAAVEPVPSPARATLHSTPVADSGTGIRASPPANREATEDAPAAAVSVPLTTRSQEAPSRAETFVEPSTTGADFTPLEQPGERAAASSATTPPGRIKAGHLVLRFPAHRRRYQVMTLVAAIAIIVATISLVIRANREDSPRLTDTQMLVPVDSGSTNGDDLFVGDVSDPTAPSARVIGGPGDQTDPAISRNRQIVIYRNIPSSPTDDMGQLWVATVDGSHKQPLFPSGRLRRECYSRPSWDPVDPTRIALVCQGPAGQALYRVDIGRDPFKVQRPTRTALTSAYARVSDPAFSPDGREIAFWKSSSNTPKGLWTVDATGTTVQQPQPLTSGNDADPVWSPHKGGVIAFRRVERPDSYIELLDTDPTTGSDPCLGKSTQLDSGTEMRLCRVTESGFAQDPSWSPDAQKIAFKNGPSNDATDTEIVTVADSGVQPLWTTQKGAQGPPAWTNR
jgi:molecular chaperone DnaK